jgi:hypothetical protein
MERRWSGLPLSAVADLNELAQCGFHVDGKIDLMVTDQNSVIPLGRPTRRE